MHTHTYKHMCLYKSTIQSSLLNLHTATKLTHFETALAAFNSDAKSSKKVPLSHPNLNLRKHKQSKLVVRQKAIKTPIHEERHSFHENEHAGNTNSCWST